MVSLFPVHRPRVGISIRAHALDLVMIRRRWGRPPLVRRLMTRLLPPGLVIPSQTVLNISDQAAFVRELRDLIAHVPDRTVAIDLPMASGALGLFHFEAFPASRGEQEALLRWRFRQDEHMAANDLHIVSRMFPGQGGADPGFSVLALAIRRSVLDQYHRTCEEAGLLPVAMGCSTLHLIDFYRRVMPSRPEVIFAHRTAEALLVLACRESRPLFLRVKPLRRATVDVQAELLTTLRYFERQFPHRPASEAMMSSLYIFEEPALPTAGSLMADAASPVQWTPVEQLPWAVEVTRVQWTTASITSAVPAPEHPPLGALASLFAS
jgi:hypothetical protein